MSDPSNDKNISRLQSLYSSDEDAKAIFDWLDSRSNRPKESKVRVVETNTGSDYYDLIDVFRKLEGWGFGRLIVGRKGGETRFSWDCDAKELAAVAKGGSGDVSGLNENPVDQAEEGAEQVQLNSYYFPLRQNHRTTLNLPADLTRSEADRLAQFIQSLAI